MGKSYLIIHFCKVDLDLYFLTKGDKNNCKLEP